ncbi:hypothetical protein GE09DRAFT_1184894 [Coniochaeta sp. 2T2.1]|nr:hypothetical protein GE09DRAFT_1184894 [Coniochaeta sp. 2T2.1]
MAPEPKGYVEGPFSGTNGNAQADAPTNDPWEVPLYVIPKKGRPSNWAKKFAPDQANAAAQATRDRANQHAKEVRKAAKPQAEKATPPKKAAPAKATPAKKRTTKPRAAKETAGGIYMEVSEDFEPEMATSKVPATPATPTPTPSPAPAKKPAEAEKEDSPVVSDTDSLFNGDVDDLFGSDEETDKPTAAQDDEDSLFVGDDEPGPQQPIATAAEVEIRRSPARASEESAQPQSAGRNSQPRFSASPSRRSVEPVQSPPAPITPAMVLRNSSTSASPDPVRPQASLFNNETGLHELRFRGSAEPEQSQHATVNPQALCLSPRPKRFQPQPALLSPQPARASPEPARVSPEPAGVCPGPTRQSPQPSTVLSKNPFYIASREGSAEPSQPRPHSPPARERADSTDIGLAAVTEEMRRWEAVTREVATETRALSHLITDLASASFQSRPPHATARSLLPAEDQARFRDQLLKATQLSLKADLVQTLADRDAETREQQFYCVVVAAVAVVVAAFLVSPFAGWVVGGLGRRGWL